MTSSGKCSNGSNGNSGVTVIIAGLLYWKEKDSFQIFLTTGAVLFIFGSILPVLLKPIYWIWMIIATILGGFMTRVILSFLFYVILTPIGLIARLFGKQFIELRWNKSKASYWNYRTTKQQKRENYEKQF